MCVLYSLLIPCTLVGQYRKLLTKTFNKTASLIFKVFIMQSKFAVHRSSQNYLGYAQRNSFVANWKQPAAQNFLSKLN